ncbi:hypothetical protein JMJ35_002041 [Cladonia borealis]|uniref:Synaptobrevin n=1 Tax=Cladonia borealis TaxID=184061 RepID=A0AA39R6V4_9LECA|nr:hypothetical protein JMJ35_002041 [Cladonia borealis]
MARGLSSNVNPQDVAAIDLARVLSRLEHKILSPDADPRLLHSSYERKKTSGNLEYARTLLLRLEHSSSSIKVPSKKHAAHTDLFAQRALIKRLTDRLHDLEAQGDDEALLNPPEDAEDILGEDDPPAASPPPTTNPTDLNSPEPSTPLPATSPPSSTLRNRHHPTKPTEQTEEVRSDITHADLLAQNDTETANLTTSLVTLAQALKASTHQFSESLLTDNEALNRATESLDKNATGMEAAGRRMGLLKRMSEGKGWWGRMMLYAWIGGLWVVAILVVFVMPKLRF